MYDDLTEGDLPDPENEAAKEVLHDVIDIVSAQASTKGKAAELRDILKKPHFQVRGRTGQPWHHIIPYMYALRYDLVIDGDLWLHPYFTAWLQRAKYNTYI